MDESLLITELPLESLIVSAVSIPEIVVLPLAVRVVAAIVPLSVIPAVVVVPVTPSVPPTVVLPLVESVATDVAPVDVIPVSPVA